MKHRVKNINHLADKVTKKQIKSGLIPDLIILYCRYNIYFVIIFNNEKKN